MLGRMTDPLSSQDRAAGATYREVLADLSAQSTLSSLAMPELWIGAVAGVVMILGAIRLRRWRDEG